MRANIRCCGGVIHVTPQYSDMEGRTSDSDHSDNKVGEGKFLSSDEITPSPRKFWFKIISVHTASVLLIILVMASPNFILFLPFPWTVEQVLSSLCIEFSRVAVNDFVHDNNTLQYKLCSCTN